MFRGALRNRSLISQSLVGVAVGSLSISSSALARMEGHQQQDGALYYELFVKMHCDGCATTVRSILEKEPSVQEILKVDVGKELVIVKSSLTGKKVVDMLVENGQEAKLIGTSVSENVAQNIPVPAEIGPVEENVSCVAEFKGQAYGHGDVVGVVRIVQQTANSSVVQASLGGLTPNQVYTFAVHCYGDPRPNQEGPVYEKGLLGSATANADGELEFSSSQSLPVWEIIGRGMVVHQGDKPENRISTSILARSAVVGSNHKKVCTCDGTVIWEANNKM